MLGYNCRCCGEIIWISKPRETRDCMNCGAKAFFNRSSTLENRRD